MKYLPNCKIILQRWYSKILVVKQPILVVGCQRSGTNMLVRALGRSSNVTVYNENNHQAFSHCRFRGAATIENLIGNSLAPVIVFKPICDSQHTDQLLDRHDGMKAIWIYRCYQDVANSFVMTWGSKVKNTIQHIAEKDFGELGWRVERFNDKHIALITRYYRDDMLPEEAAALVWYLRNQFYYQLQLNKDNRVLLVKYEDLVLHPNRFFKRIFDFVGCPFNTCFTDNVVSTSIGKRPFPPIDHDLHNLCEELLTQINRDYETNVEIC